MRRRRPGRSPRRNASKCCPSTGLPSQVFTEPYKLAAASVQPLRNAKADQQHRFVLRGKWCVSVAVTRGITDRVMVVYDALIKAREKRGWVVTVVESEQGAPTVGALGEKIGIAVEERVGRVEPKPGPREERI